MAAKRKKPASVKQEKEKRTFAVGLDNVLKKLNEEFGEGTIVRASERQYQAVPRMSTGSYSLDVETGGGWPRGRLIHVFGPQCLASETFVPYEVWGNDVVRRNHKGGTIERLFERFHNVRPPGDLRGRNNRKMLRADCFYTLPSMDEKGRIVRNRIQNVVFSGEKECYRVSTLGGFSIEASAEHRFSTPCGFMRLKHLRVGDEVHLHTNSVGSSFLEKTPQIRRSTVEVKHHPFGSKKIVEEKYVYYRVYRSRLVVEANMNNLSYDAYIFRLNTGATSGLTFLEPDVEVHHKDLDPLNDTLSNLEPLNKEEHHNIHSQSRGLRTRYKHTAELQKIVSIIPVGKRKTYDICMEEPLHNFVAEGFVVHNSSGKSYLAYLSSMLAQQYCVYCSAHLDRCKCGAKTPGNVAWEDIEMTDDPDWRTRIGVNRKQFLPVKVDYGEQVPDITDSLIRSGAVNLVVIDSAAALVPRENIEKSADQGMSPGARARIMALATRKWAAALNTHLIHPKTQKPIENLCTIMVLNQLTESISRVPMPPAPPCGRALRHAASIELQLGFAMDDIDWSEEDPTGEQYATKQTVHFTTVKNKTYAPKRSGAFTIDFTSGQCGNEYAVWHYARRFGFVKQSGSWYEWTDGKHKWRAQGEDNSVELFSRPDVFSSMKALVDTKVEKVIKEA